MYFSSLSHIPLTFLPLPIYIILSLFSHPTLTENQQQRGLSYHRILAAGHLVPHDQPRVMYEYVREFVLGGGCH